jgi:hypothetical protein
MIFSTVPLSAFAGRKRSNSLGRTSPGKYQSFSLDPTAHRKALPRPFERKRSRGKSFGKARDGWRSRRFSGPRSSTIPGFRGRAEPWTNDRGAGFRIASSKMRRMIRPAGSYNLLRLWKAEAVESFHRVTCRVSRNSNKVPGGAANKPTMKRWSRLRLAASALSHALAALE